MISLCGLSVRILKVRQRHDQFNLLHKHLKKETAKPQPKAVELKIIKDVVKGYDLPKRGSNPKGIVIHNDAGCKGRLLKHIVTD